MIRLFLGVLLVSAAVERAQGISPEVEDEWDALDSPTKELYRDETKNTPAAEFSSVGKHKETEQAHAVRPKSLKDYVFPYAMALFLGSSLIFALVGGRHNAKLTVAFEDSFCKEPEGILWKQFTRLGRGGGNLLVNDSTGVFKLHANGHRHLEGAVTTMTLLRRHEMMSFLLQWLTKQEDSVCLELYVKDGSMPQIVLAIVTTANYKELLRTNEDVKELCTRLEVKEEKIKDWPQDLVVFAEHPSYFYDMMTKPMLSQVFGLVAFQKQRQYFKGLHITSVGNSSHRQIIRFWFRVPRASEMDHLLTLMTAVFAMVNQVDGYSISPERLKQTEQARQEFAKRTAPQEPVGAFAKEVAENKRARRRK